MTFAIRQVEDHCEERLALLKVSPSLDNTWSSLHQVLPVLGIALLRNDPSCSANNSDFISSGKLGAKVRIRPFMPNLVQVPDALKVDFLGFIIVLLRCLS